MQGVATKGKQSWAWWLNLLFLVFLVQVLILNAFVMLNFVRSTSTSTKVPKQNLQPQGQVWQICKVWMHQVCHRFSRWHGLAFEDLRAEEVLSRHGPRRKRPLWSVLLAAIVEMTSNLQLWMKSFLLDIGMITDCKNHNIEELHQAFLEGPILVSSKFRRSQFVQSATPHGQSRWVADSRFEHEPCVIDETSEKQ